MLLTWWQSRPSFQFCHFATWHVEETNMWWDAWWSSWPKTCFVQRPFRLCFYHHHCRQLAWKTNRSGHSLTYQEKWGNIENEAQLTMPKYRKLKSIWPYLEWKFRLVMFTKWGEFWLRSQLLLLALKLSLHNVKYVKWMHFH